MAVGLGPEAGDTPADKGANSRHEYPWGNEWPPPAGAGNYAGEEMKTTSPADAVDFPVRFLKVGVPGYEDGYVYTSPVGSFAANRFGLYDMGGNVWQLCRDPIRPSEPSRFVLRGSGWSPEGEYSMRSAYRTWAGEAAPCVHIGFRVVLVPDSAVR